VALSLALLVTAVLFVKTMANLRAVDLGFGNRNVLTLSLDPVVPGAAAQDAREQLWRRTLERVRALPGVRAASLSVLTPLSGRDTATLVTASGYTSPSTQDRSVHVNHVSEDYFRAFGMRLIRGRAFTRADAEPSAKVAVINEAAARAYFANREAIGESLDFGRSGVYQIVGVVQDAKHMSLREPAPRFVFVPLWQPLDRIGRITLAVSSEESPASLVRAVKSEIEALHANTLVSDVIAVDEQIGATLVSERLLATLATAFAALALGLSAIGLFGTLSYAVARRTPELGIRIAMGAEPARVAWSVFRDMLLQVACGVAIGLPAALAAAITAKALVFAVAPTDPGLYLLSAAILTTVASLAAWLPARRAASIDPSLALRRE
jgi:putative ABC transport system permease protein